MSLNYAINKIVTLMSIKGPLWVHCSTHTASWSVSAAYLCSSTHTHTLLQLRCTRSRSEGPVVSYVLRVKWSLSSSPVAIPPSCDHMTSDTHISVSLLQILIEKALLESGKALLFQSLRAAWMWAAYIDSCLLSETHPQAIDLKRLTVDSDI